ncbi:MAG: hypothetical protein O6934_12025 [SAR324 cluster bacterium]|nr:hypothetical protein [SAR324 cluster bacterium]
MQPIRFYIGVIGFFLAALVAGVFYFLIGMGNASYLVNDGVGYGMHYIDKPSYDSNLQGLIFTISFLTAGGLLMFMVLMPDQQSEAARAQRYDPPQPRRRQAAPQPPAPRPQPVAAPEPAPSVADQDSSVSPTVEIDADSLAEAAAPPEAPEPEPAMSVDEEVLSADEADEFDIEEVSDSRYDDTGDEDIVYGNGRVTDESIWEFVQDYPDSAVKFLYRKTLDNKSLTPSEEDIYRRWEMRGMTRAKVREFVLETMGRKSLPDDFPHNIWRELRDQIFEMKSRQAS